MSIAYVVPIEFINQRDLRQQKYNARGRDLRQHLMDIDAELYEYYLINEKKYEDDDRWEVDFKSGGTTYDAKCISKWYNISQMKMCYLLRQHGITDKFSFWEWQVRPDRPLEAGDHVVMNHLLTKDYWDIMKNIQPSKFNNGYYVDVRKMLK